MELEKPRVLITGATGFIASWIVKYAVESDEYIVRAAVRNLSDDTKLDGLKNALGERYTDIELVEVDLDKEETVKEAIRGCSMI